MRFELASYAPNVEAGEEVRILPVPAGGSWPADVPPADFWLIDSAELWEMSYDEDGTWLSAAPVEDPTRIAAARQVRAAALARARDWSDYMGTVRA